MGRDADRVEEFHQLYSATFSSLLAYCRRRTRSDGDADDAVAETYLVAWRRLDDALGADSPVAWLYGVARRVLANQRRGSDRADRLRERLRVQPRPALATEPADQVARDSEVAAAYAALGRLDGRDQELIRLAALEELSYAEIATVLGMRVGAVRSRLFRARQRLKAAREAIEGRDDRSHPDTESGRGPDDSRPDDTAEEQS